MHVRQVMAEAGAEEMTQEEHMLEMEDFEEEDPEGDLLSGYQVLLMDPEDLGIIETVDGSDSGRQDGAEDSGAPAAAESEETTAQESEPRDDPPGRPSQGASEGGRGAT